MVVITGVAGFIGSCLLRALNNLGIKDIIGVERFAANCQWQNIYEGEFIDVLDVDSITDIERYNENIDVVIHLGAIVSTYANDSESIMKYNYTYTKYIFELCQKWNSRLIYMSSASVYGAGVYGFSEDVKCTPKSIYAFSKSAFDQWQAYHALKLRQCVGLRLFNVYGPNEQGKNSMSSLVTHFYESVQNNEPIIIYGDGKQSRDFVYVYDVIKVIKFFLDHNELNGIYNVGTGEAVSFVRVAQVIKDVIGKTDVDIIYKELPMELREQYQFYTCADIKKLRSTGYKEVFRTIDVGVSSYISEVGKTR